MSLSTTEYLVAEWARALKWEMNSEGRCLVSDTAAQTWSRRQGYGQYAGMKRGASIGERKNCGRRNAALYRMLWTQQDGIYAEARKQWEGFKFCKKVHFYMFFSFKWMLWINSAFISHEAEVNNKYLSQERWSPQHQSSACSLTLWQCFGWAN